MLLLNFPWRHIISFALDSLFNSTEQLLSMMVFLSLQSTHNRNTYDLAVRLVIFATKGLNLEPFDF